MKFFWFLSSFLLVCLTPLAAGSTMTGGNFEVYADSFSALPDNGSSGGTYTLLGSSGDVGAGIVRRGATGTIVSPLNGGGIFGGSLVLSDGAVTTTFDFVNRAGFGNGTIENGNVIIDIGGAGGGDVATMLGRIAEAINHANANLDIDATSNGVDRVLLVNVRIGGEDSAAPITETVANASFVVSGMSGGGGYFLYGGFPSMEKASLTLSLSTTSISLGTLSLSSVTTSSVTLTLGTDSSSGYEVTVTEDTNFKTAGGETIDDVADGTVTAGQEEYGIQTSGASGLYNNAAVALTSGGGTLAENTGIVSNDAVEVEFQAAVGGETLAGSYAHSVTFTLTANP